ncbi:Beta-amyrin 24-hydroxylase [Morella rubra]|uniref:Beta-amyrin 24-hydroxylase n=1 Tax=Morella rubra TaxID=262757 RepID=A0A6A1WHI7_9ROSI|nr:Beta-amyrin 24-hydroxylase [Morella rubra]
MAINMTESHYYFLCFFLWLLSALLLRSSLKKRNKQVADLDLHLPPSPAALPVLGHLHLLGRSLYQSLDKLSSKYGPLLYLRLGPSRRLLVVSSASMATEVFKTNDLAFSDRPSFAFEEELPYGSEGFFSAKYGEYWRFMKKVCMTQLLGAKQLEQSRSIRREEIASLLCRVLESGQKKEVIDLGAELMKLTNNATCRLAMSTRVSGETNEAEQIRDLVKESLKLATKVCFGDVLGPFKRLSFWLYGKQAIDVTMKYDGILERIWKEHEETGHKENEQDLMDILLKVYKNDKAEFQMTRNHVKALLLDIFVAGTGSSGEVMQWTMSELINNPHILKKLREEISSVVGTGRLVDESDIPNLPYLQAVVKETLRLYPPLAVTTRECREHCKIKGYDIPQNTMVAINLYSVMRDPEVWDNPNEFRPERFLVSSTVEGHDNETTIKGRNLVDFVPFGAGRRGCPGSALAYNTINSTIASLVQCFDWKAGASGDEAKVNMEVGVGLSLAKAHSLVCLPVVLFNPFRAP